MLRPQMLLLLVALLACYHAAKSSPQWRAGPLPLLDFKAMEQGEHSPDSEPSTTTQLRAKRGATDFRRKKWNKAVPIPYVFDTSFTDDQKTIIRAAVQTFIDNTCIDFQENFDDGNKWKLEYIRAKSGKCNSPIGDQRDNERSRENQFINLRDYCVHTASVQHETMHSLGFRHTQVRPDRDNYVKVFETEATIDNSNYDKLEIREDTTDYGIPYEFNSILHYSADDDMKPIDDDYLTTTGGSRMIFNDWKLINMHYKCSESCSNEAPITCRNGGYQHPRHCDRCVCAQFHKGQYCEEELGVVNLVKGESKSLNAGWEFDLDIFNKRITDTDQFDRSSVHIIKAPEGARIRVTIDNITNPFGNDSVERNCYMYALEIVDADMTRVGKRFCSYSNVGHTVLSTTNVIGYVVYQSPGFGFAANVTFTVEGTSTVPDTVPEPASTSGSIQSEEPSTIAPLTETPETQTVKFDQSTIEGLPTEATEEDTTYYFSIDGPPNVDEFTD